MKQKMCLLDLRGLTQHFSTFKTNEFIIVLTDGVENPEKPLFRHSNNSNQYLGPG